MGGVDEVAGFNAKVDMDERIGSVGWVLSKGIAPNSLRQCGPRPRSGVEYSGHTYVRTRLFRNDHDGVTGPSVWTCMDRPRVASRK